MPINGILYATPGKPLVRRKCRRSGKQINFFKKKIRTVTTDAKSGLVTLTVRWTDPHTAAKWANDLVHLTNQYRRERAIKESEQNIAYLTAEAGKTDVLGVRQAIYSILQNEISKMMLARGNEQYALKVIDPAIPPEKPASPMPALWTLIAFLGSMVFVFGFAFVRAALVGPDNKSDSSKIKHRHLQRHPQGSVEDETRAPVAER